MRKLPIELENPIDNLIIDICEQTNWFYKMLKFTPNILTTFSLVFGLLSVWLFAYDYRILSAITFLISYYYDCADGSFARQYDMVTEFGDIYDHVSDNLKGLLFFIIMYMKNSLKFFAIFPLILFFVFSICLHLGCQESLYNKHNKPGGASIGILKSMVFADPIKLLRYTRYFACGTSIILMTILILLY